MHLFGIQKAFLSWHKHRRILEYKMAELPGCVTGFAIDLSPKIDGAQLKNWRNLAEEGNYRSFTMEKDREREQEEDESETEKAVWALF